MSAFGAKADMPDRLARCPLMTQLGLDYRAHVPPRMYWSHTTSPQTILPRTLFISSNENARRVSDRTFPREPTLNASADALSSSGASQIATTSWLPSVQ